MPSLFDDPYASHGGLLGLDAPRIQQPDQNNPDQGAALAQAYQAVTDAMKRQQQISADKGLWRGGQPWEGGGPTQAGLLDATRQATQSLLLGTEAPGEGFTAYHGSPASFERFDLAKVHPDEAGHYVTQDESLARDYAGRYAGDPTAGHMYQVNVKADPSQFLDYGSLHPADQAALNEPGAIQKLRDAGVPGIKTSDGTYVVFNDSTLDIARKYGIAGLMAGGGAAAATEQPQQ